MTEALQKVPKNIMATGLGQILGTVLGFLATVLTARYLGVAGFGRFNFLYGLALVAWLILEAGLMNILVRELSQRLGDREDYNFRLGAFRGLINCICVATLGGAVLIIWLGGLDAELGSIVLLLGLALVSILQSLTFASVVRAHEDMEYYALGFTLKHLFLLGAVYGVTYLDAGFVAIFLAYTSAYIFAWGYYWLVVRARYGLNRSVLDLASWQYFLKESLPLGLGHVMRRTTNYVDIFILRATSSAIDIGLFSTAYRFIFIMSGMAMVIGYPFLPVFSRLALKDKTQLGTGLEKGLLFFIITAIPLIIIFLVYGKTIITVFFGASFAEAGRDLQLLSFALLFIFPGTLLMHLFTALGKQGFWTLCTGCCLGVNTLLDLLLTPKWGHLGAVWGTMTAEIVMFGMAWYLLHRLSFRLSLPRLLARPLLAGIGGGALLYAFPGESLGETCGLAASALALYVLLLWLMRVFTVKSLVELVRGQQPLRGAG